ncbi:LacI family transcriptional regulator [bacterium]|nr:MAG: LacI family transcriptional regulator [bacterium]
MGVTIKEVAKAAGVSSAAVSCVLHGRGTNIRVSEARAEQIRRVAAELRYVPNALARSLRVNRTHTIGLLFENFSGIASGPRYIVTLLDGVARTIFPLHYRLTILSEFDHDNVFGSLGDGRLDGVIWCKMARDDKVLEQIRTCPIPIVSMNGTGGGAGTAFVACDNRQGIELALDHLAELGHRSVLFVNEREEDDAPDCLERREAFLSGLASRGMTGEAVSWGWDLREFSLYRQAGGNHTAIVAWSERCAGQLLARAAECGLSVPEDLSVVGFDSTEYCETTQPRLTAVRQPIYDMAARASETLIDLIEGTESLPSSTLFPCTLDIRGSTARPSQS